jgi:hypothetical protein
LKTNTSSISPTRTKGSESPIR